MVKVLALPGLCFSSRQVVSFLNFRSFYFNQNHTNYVQLTSRPSNFHRSRPIPILPRNNQFSCSCSTSFEQEKDCNDDTSANTLTSPRSYDKISGSLSSLSSTRSCCCNCQNTSPSIQINIVFPQTVQLGIFPAITMLVRLYNILDSFLDNLLCEKVIFFQV